MSLWSRVYKPGRKTRAAMGALCGVMFFVAAAGTIGSVYQIVRSARRIG